MSGTRAFFAKFSQTPISHLGPHGPLQGDLARSVLSQVVTIIFAEEGSVPCSMRDLSSLMRDRTHAPCSESVEC